MFRTIVCPTDFSPAARDALSTAARIALRTNAELVLVHAWHVPSSMYTGSCILPASFLADVRRDAERRLEAERSEAERRGVARIRTSLVRGVAWDQIVDALENEQADLCVIGKHGRTGPARILPGSTTERVTRHASCPVLVVPSGEDRASFNQVLCLVDFSEHSRAALDRATRLVAANGSLTLLHVVDIPSILGNEISSRETRHMLERRAREALSDWEAVAATQTNAHVRTNVRTGSPRRQIAAMLDDLAGTDLVVAGSCGRTGIRRVLLGSVAECVMRDARCPVLLVRQADPAAKRDRADDSPHHAFD